VIGATKGSVWVAVDGTVVGSKIKSMGAAIGLVSMAAVAMVV
jgi:hypothetical protein